MTDPDQPATSNQDRPEPVGIVRPTETDRPTDRLRLVPLGEAARLSGLSAEAIRLRIRRGTLPSTKANDGRLLVRVADLGDLAPGRPTATDHDRPPPTDRVTLDASRLIDRLEALEIEREAHAAELLEQAERYGRELAEVRERAAKAEAEVQAAGRERQAAEAARDRAERRQDAAEAELRDLRRPLWERVVRAIRQPR